MTMHLLPLPSTDYEPATEDAGLGALRTDRGNLPLETLDVAVAIAGLTARVQLSQGFHNPYGVPLEATYIFPLPDRAAVTAMRMEADGRVIDGVLRERARARAEYRQAISEGRRASIAEEERPDVFTMRVGNILPGERVTVRLTLAQPLPYSDGAATFRFPLVVAPRYVPGEPLPGEPVGAGWAEDTGAVPDASRISPPVLLPGFPHPVALSIGVDVDPGGLPLTAVRSSLHAVNTEGSHLSISPGERADRDFVLRLDYGEPDANAEALLLAGDTRGDGSSGDGGDGTFQLTVLPPAGAGPTRPRDVVLVLDRSGSMGGWKIVAARRAAARIVDTLTGADRFAVLTFDNRVERPAGLAAGLVPATDRNRYRAVEHLSRVDPRGGTEMLPALTEATGLLAAEDAGHDRVLVLVTDGQIGNEDQVLAALTAPLAGIRVHTIGIDRAVNAGFLTRLAVVGGGRCELVESEDRLDEAAEHIHRRICTPLVTDVELVTGVELVGDIEQGQAAGSLEPVPDTVAPARLPDLFPGVPLVITGRWRGSPGGALGLRGRTGAGEPWRASVPAVAADAPALAPIWARAHLRDLEDRYLAADRGTTADLERRIVATSLRFGVLCRFTAYLAIDSRVVTDGGQPHQVTQPVEPASGWDMLSAGGRPAPYARSTRSHRRVASPDRVAESAAGPWSGPARPDDRPGLTPEIGLGATHPDISAIDPEWRGARRPDARPPSQAPPGRFGATPIPPLLPDADPLGWARVQAGLEVRRLHAAAHRPLLERHTMLVDLGNRLAALLYALGGLGAAEAGIRRLHELAGVLRSVPMDKVDELWLHAVTALGAFCGQLPAEPPPAPRPRRGGDFWRR